VIEWRVAAAGEQVRHLERLRPVDELAEAHKPIAQDVPLQALLVRRQVRGRERGVVTTSVNGYRLTAKGCTCASHVASLKLNGVVT